MDYSFCESVHATPYSKWHIRKLTNVGKKLGGGADTKSLCGRDVNWDLSIDIGKFNLENSKDEAQLWTIACPVCLEVYEKENL